MKEQITDKVGNGIILKKLDSQSKLEKVHLLNNRYVDSTYMK